MPNRRGVPELVRALQSHHLNIQGARVAEPQVPGACCFGHCCRVRGRPEGMSMPVYTVLNRLHRHAAWEEQLPMSMQACWGGSQLCLLLLSVGPTRRPHLLAHIPCLPLGPHGSSLQRIYFDAGDRALKFFTVDADKVAVMEEFRGHSMPVFLFYKASGFDQFRRALTCRQRILWDRGCTSPHVQWGSSALASYKLSCQVRASSQTIEQLAYRALQCSKCTVREAA